MQSNNSNANNHNVYQNRPQLKQSAITVNHNHERFERDNHQ